MRKKHKPQIKEQMKAAHEKGTPVMRPLMYDFSYDQCAWEVEDEYMFGSDLLVCPVTQEGVCKRTVYFPILENDEN